MFTTRKALALGAALLTVITLSSCMGTVTGPMGSDMHETSTATTTEAFNADDIMFAQMMIPHHEQAVEMSDLLLDKEGIDTDVRDLATRIKAAQTPEIATMESWLDAWGADMGGMAGMNHGTDGMMSDSDMSALEAADGSEASRLYLEGMITHHEGAIAMAEIELESGENADALALAQAIITSQTAEIDEMTALLASL
jgi:uncharacterized protein (DUF305 family)